MAYKLIEDIAILLRVAMSLTGAQALGQVAPFFVERLARRESFAGLTVPITRVRFVAFLTMQISVEAGGRLRRNVLNDLMRGVPITALVAPERGQIGRQSFGR